jgi:prepilin-type N-terminal cleavage/methylation domain-containing protein
VRLRGFTLVETLVVMIAIALSAVIVAPRIGPFIESRRVSSFRLDALTLFRAAREEAILSGRAIQVVVSEDALLAQYIDDAAESEEPQGLSNDPLNGESNQTTEGLEIFRSQPFPDSVTADQLYVDGNPVSLTEWAADFYSTGQGTDAAIEFESAGRIFSITIKESTGNIDLVDGPAPQDEEQSWEAGELETRIQEE